MSKTVESGAKTCVSLKQTSQLQKPAVNEDEAGVSC